jgi:N-methylhydantoinase A
VQSWIRTIHRHRITQRLAAMYRIGVDIGGTFTDFTVVDKRTGGLSSCKVKSTPHDPSIAIEEGILRLRCKFGIVA